MKKKKVQNFSKDIEIYLVNDKNKFYGPMRLKIALAKSINLASIRILDNIGIDYAIDFISKFGFAKNWT